MQRQLIASPERRHPRSASARPAWWLLALLSSAAHAEGSVELRWLSVTPPQTLLDGLGLTATYQTTFDRQNLSLNTTVDRSSQTFSVNYRRPQHTAQLSANRRVDQAADSSATSLSSSYTYVPTPSTSGAALTSVTGLYNLNLNHQKTSDTRTQTFGVALSARLMPNLTATGTGIANLVQVGDTDTRSGAISTSVTYSKDKTNASLAASSNIQATTTTYNLAASASTELAPNLTGTASGNWSGGQKPSLTATTTYVIDSWTIGANASLAEAKLNSVGATASVKLPRDFTVSSSVNYGVQSRSTTVGVTGSTKLGGLTISTGVNASLPAEGKPSYGAQASLSGTQKPWNGSINLSANRSATSTYGTANGTLSYTNNALTLQTSLGLNLNSSLNGGKQTTTLTGTADFSTSYAVNDRFALSALARYERSTDPAATARYRLGAGLRYRF